MKLSIYRKQYYHEGLDQFRDIYLDLKLTSLASDLCRYGIDSQQDIDFAVKRAIKACQALGLRSREHFKEIYTCRNGSIFRDWKLSDLGKKLVILNANTENPLVARFQINLLNQLH